MTFTIISILLGVALIDPIRVCGEPKGKITLPQERGRDPFLLPPEVRPVSNKAITAEAKGTSFKLKGNPTDVLPSPLKVKAILISDRIRLALIDRHIVTIGDPIQDEKVLEIKSDRVILGKGNQSRTLLLSQSPISLAVEERKGE